MFSREKKRKFTIFQKKKNYLNPSCLIILKMQSKIPVYRLPALKVSPGFKFTLFLQEKKYPKQKKKNYTFKLETVFEKEKTI